MIVGGISIPDTKGLLLIGPVMATSCFLSQAHAILAATDRSSKDLSAIMHLFSQYACCNVNGLLANLRLLFFTMYKTPCPTIEKVPFHWKKRLPNTELPLIESSVSTANDVKDTLLSFVKYGREKELNEYLEKKVLFQMENEYPLHTISAMRTALWGSIVLVAHTACEAGLDKALTNELITLYNEQIGPSVVRKEILKPLHRWVEDDALLCMKSPLVARDTSINNLF